jgi:hypothetical protein
MSLVYKAGQPVIDINKVNIVLPPDQPLEGPNDIMQQLRGATPQGATKEPGGAAPPPSSGDPQTDELLKQLGGK